MAKRKANKLIPAVGYLRKSSKGGVTDDGRPQHEKSIADQKARIAKLKPAEPNAEYDIRRWYTDPGIPGWKRGHKRPDYFKLVNNLREQQDVEALLCDDMDRFSRADPMETVSDVQELRELGIRYIHAANQGIKDLTQNVALVAMQVAMEANASHEFSTRLSRRVTAAHRDRAASTKRAGRAPYGYATDGKGGLKLGNPKEVKVVRRIYSQFVDNKLSMNAIAGELNAAGTPAPRGGKWYVATVKDLLMRPAYCGDFNYGRRQQGQFFTTSSKGEVIDAKERTRPSWQYGDPAFSAKKAWKPLIQPKQWQAAQARIASFAMSGNRRPRKDGFPLSRILICSHCGKPMYGCHPTGRKYRVYRCSTNAKSGMGTCGTYEVREEQILPWVLRKLWDEIGDIRKVLSSPPDEVLRPETQEAAQREELVKERDKLLRQIDAAEERILAVADDRTRQSLDHRVTAMRDRLDEIVGLLAQAPSVDDYSREQLAPLVAWLENFERQAIAVPVEGGLPVLKWWQTPDGVQEEGHETVLVDARVLNEMLHDIGARVTLRWRTDKVELSNGKVQNRYTLTKARYQLGQQKGEIARKNGVMFCNAKVTPLYKTLPMLARVDRVFDGKDLVARVA